jgi:hypothetical protein
MKVIDITGQKFNRWTVIKRVENDSKGHAKWLCQCDCGNYGTHNSTRLMQEYTKSCGCFKNDNPSNYRHGHAQKRISPTYNTWAGMKARCTDPKNQAYKHYGARGIKVCERWMTFANFLEDMGEKPEGTSLDRIDHSGDYCKENCKWSTHLEQARNKRSNRNISFNGETLCLMEWAERLGLNVSSLAERLDKWPLEKALTTPKLH